MWKFRSKVSIEDGLLLSLDCVHVLGNVCPCGGVGVALGTRNSPNSPPHR